MSDPFKYYTRNTTPAKPQEGRFGYIWFVCKLKFQGWCSKSGPKSNTHCASYIVHELTADHILTSSKMAASSVNYRGEALFANVFKKNLAYDRMENLYLCMKKIVNMSYEFFFFFQKKKNVKTLCASLRYES